LLSLAVKRFSQAGSVKQFSGKKFSGKKFSGKKLESCSFSKQDFMRYTISAKAWHVLFVILFITIFIGVDAASAQTKVTLSGKVRDSESAEDLIGAQVFAEGTSRGVTTNVYGFFALNLPAGEYTIVVRYQGYRDLKQKLSLTDDKTQNFDLKPLTGVAEEIVVEAQAANENVKSTEMSVVQLSIDQVKQLPVILGETDILKTLTLLPGVTTQSEGTTGFNVRGGSADQNLILLDEATLYNASHLFGFFSVFNQDAVKDFKLYKAAIPASFGGRLSSVLDVRQRDGNQKEFHGAGGIGLISSRFTFDGPIVRDKGSFMVAGRRSYADLFLQLSPDSAIRNNVAFFYDLNLKANYQVGENDRLFLSGYFGRDNFGIANIFGFAYGNTTMTLRWNHIFGKKLFSNFSAIYNNYDYEIRSLSPGSAFEVQSNIINYSAKVDLSYFMNSWNKLDFGAESVYYTFVPGDVIPIRNSTVNATRLDRKYSLESSFYLADEISVTDNLALDLGVRYNTFLRLGDEAIVQYANNRPVVFNAERGIYQNGTPTDTVRFGAGDVINSFGGFEPRAALRLSVSPVASLKASYTRTRQNIHLISNTASPTPLDLYTPSGQYIAPQTADQLALGYFQNFKENDYEFSLEVYYKRLNNVIDFVDGANLVGNNNIETEVLTGEGRAYGLELYLQKKRGDFTGWISYTLGRAERRIPGTDGGTGINFGNWYAAGYDKTHNLSLVGTYKLSRTWTLSSVFVFATGIPINYPVGRYDFSNLVISVFDGTRNAQRLPSYNRLDFSARWESQKPSGFRQSWVIGIYNLYNRRNASSIIFRENEERPRTNEAVRTAFFGIVPSVSWEFKF
jgi:hypothetical protein